MVDGVPSDSRRLEGSVSVLSGAVTRNRGTSPVRFVCVFYPGKSGLIEPASRHEPRMISIRFCASL